jgi:hypothetical protein
MLVLMIFIVRMGMCMQHRFMEKFVLVALLSPEPQTRRDS